MSARMGLLAQLSLRMDAIPAHQLIREHRAEVLREAAEVAVRAARSCGEDEMGQYAASITARVGAELRRMADAAEQREPDMPTCTHCRQQTGPWQPTGDRYPSGAQVLECRGGCKQAGEKDTRSLGESTPTASGCVCRTDPAECPAHEGHAKWCPASRPTVERIAEIRQGIGDELTRDELHWLSGAAGRNEAHIIGARGGHWPLTDDIPGVVVLLAQYLAATVAVIERSQPYASTSPSWEKDTREGKSSHPTEGPVHAWFELSYSTHQVLPRTLMQSMPIEWQKRMVACLEEMHAAFEHVEQPECYKVEAATEHEVSDLTDAQMKALGITQDWYGGATPPAELTDVELAEWRAQYETDPVYYDANGTELDPHSTVFVPAADPLPNYRHSYIEPRLGGSR